MIEPNPDSQDTAPRRVVLVDDHEFVLEGVKQRFDEADDLTVIAVADSVKAGVVLVGREQPDVAVVDYRLPDGNGIELVERIRELSPDTDCVIYTSVSFPEDLEHQADAVVIKALFEDKLIETIRAINVHSPRLNGSSPGNSLHNGSGAAGANQRED